LTGLIFDVRIWEGSRSANEVCFVVLWNCSCVLFLSFFLSVSFFLSFFLYSFFLPFFLSSFLLLFSIESDQCEHGHTKSDQCFLSHK
jgi:hypothetical protein